MDTIADPGKQGSLTFTTTNWKTNQTVTVTGVDNDIDETNRTTTVTHDPSGADYGSVANATLTVTATDDDTLGVTLDPESPTVTEGTPQSFNVKLDSQPLGDVTITFSESSPHFNITRSPLTFSSTTWNTVQRITITPTVDDDANDHTGTITASISSEDDSAYDDLDDITMNVTIEDDDEQGLDISDTTVSVGEDGGAATYKVSLTSKPTGNVTVTVTSNATGVATVDTSYRRRPTRAL